MSTNTIPMRPVKLGGAVTAKMHARAQIGHEGSLDITSTEALGAYPTHMGEKLAHWAQAAPTRSFVARRDTQGVWQHISYAQMWQRARAIGQALLERGLTAERPLVILSDNDLEHLQLAMGAMLAGVPYAPISPAYSLLSQDYGKLKHIIDLLTPGLVFAANTPNTHAAYCKAIQTVVPSDVEVLLTHNTTLAPHRCTLFNDLINTAPGALIDAAFKKLNADTIVKFLFTSGSTKLPKGVINTQRMLCSNQQMIAQCFVFFSEQPPVVLDWLPWNHTFGGNHNVGIVLYNGGTLYIDDGKPTSKGIIETLRNLREIAPTVYFNVPKGWEEITAVLERDEALAKNFFSQVQLFFFAGAGLPQNVWDRLEAIAFKTCGYRIKMCSGLGMTETAPSSTFALGEHIGSGHVGLPCPGCETKLVNVDGKLEVRFRGPHVMPGYWRAPEQTFEAFDEEGFYRTGDALLLVDENNINAGLKFDGRLAEDFKLMSGTFVNVGPLRAKVIAQGAPYVQDVVVTGINRNDVGMLVLPRMADCATLAQLPANATPAQIVQAAPVRAFFQTLLNQLYASGTGGASKIARARLLAVPPSIDKGEITDKGSINQRAVLTHRAALVDELYEGQHADVLLAQPT